MKKGITFLFLALSIAFGFWMAKKPEVKPTVGRYHPDKEYPLSERKSFAFVVYAHNQAFWCERALRSIFEQEYDHYRVVFIDDGSTDGTFEIAKTFILENNQDQRVILMRNETELGPVACLYRAVSNCLDKEIVIPFDAKNWLSHSSSLARMNEVFQNPDVWIAETACVKYPSYEIEGKGLRGFYAALFKQIRLSDLFREEKFAISDLSYFSPLCDLAGGRMRNVKEPLMISNETRSSKMRIDPFLPVPYSPLAEFPKTHPPMAKCDILLFSFDRPLQLYSCLESIYRYVSGFESVTVLYRVTDDRFSAGYDQVRQAFPMVRYVRQSEDPKRDFKPLVLKSVFSSPSEYVIFGVDDIVVKDAVDLKLCTEMMEKTGAYGFYLRFGRHIHFCYQNGKAQSVPASIPLTQNIYAWDLKKGEGDWGYPNSLDMTVFRKKDLKNAFEKMKFKTPNSLEFIWASEHAPQEAIGLYFEQSKIVNIPLNIVGRTGNPHMNFSSPEELLAKFNEGFKIDIEPLHQIENHSPHFEHIPSFIPR